MASHESGPQPRLRMERAARTLGRPAIAAAIGGAILVWAIATNSIEATNQSLQFIGFDADRAQLLTALIFAALIGATATLVTGRRLVEVTAGIIAAALLFTGTFASETATAMRSNGGGVVFDPPGWLLTLGTLLLSAVVASWAGSALAADLRPTLVDVAASARIALQGRHMDRRPMARLAAVVAVLIALVVALPAFGDMVNFTPDALMTRGGAPPAGLGGPIASSGPLSPPITGSTASPGSSPGDSATASAPPFGSDARPWLAWTPTGTGRVATFDLRAPWTGGLASATLVDVYTPPGYSRNSPYAYPVIYEAPWGVFWWNSGAHLQNVMDSLIDRGIIPPTIVVFIDPFGGPHPDTECSNSADGREWVDTYISQTVVGWVDARYRTIRSPIGRAVIGMSQGGYCASILVLRHPDVFGTAISFSGYFQAGIFAGTAVSIFGDNKAILTAASPLEVAPQLPPQVRASTAFILVAEPAQPVYGTQATEFETVLQANGYPSVYMRSSLPHGWGEVRQKLEPALVAWASRLGAANPF